MNILIDTLVYIIQTPLFYSSMGFTVSIAMFVGAYIFDGNLAHVRRGTAAILSYAMMLLWFTSIRVYSVTNGFKIPACTGRPEMAFAGIVAIILLTIAWLSGMLLGVYLIHRFHKEKKDE